MALMANVRFTPKSVGTESRNVRFVPIADSCSAAKGSLFDHLVGAGEQ